MKPKHKLVNIEEREDHRGNKGDPLRVLYESPVFDFYSKEIRLTQNEQERFLLDSCVRQYQKDLEQCEDEIAFLNNQVTEMKGLLQESMANEAKLKN